MLKKLERCNMLGLQKIHIPQRDFYFSEKFVLLFKNSISNHVRMHTHEYV